MAISAAELVAEVKIVGAAAARAELQAVGVAVGVAAAAIAVKLGVDAAKAAGNFQAGLTRLYTTAGESSSKLGMVSDGILAMSVAVGTGAQKLLDAMYWVESAGFHGAAGLSVLKIAAMGAKAENASVTDVVKVLTSALNAYAGTGLTAATAMNTLIAATSVGKMTLGDLANAVASVLPATAKFHISLVDTTAAIATMTMQGDKASNAATHLRQMILALEAPSAAGAKALASIGLSTKAVADEMKVSLPGAIQMITDDLAKKFPVGSAAYNQALKNISGGSKQMMAMLELSGTHLAAFRTNVASVTSAVKKGGDSIMGWSEVQKNFNFKLDQGKAAFDAMMIILGTKLLPILGNVVSTVSTLIVRFTQWITNANAVKATFAPVVDGFNRVKQTAIDLWTQLQPVFHFIGSILGPAFQTVGQIIMHTIVPAWQQMIAAIQPALPALKFIGMVIGGIVVAGIIAFGLALAAIGAVIALVVAGVLLLVKSFLNFLTFMTTVVNGVKAVWVGIPGFFGGIFHWIANLATSVWNGIKSVTMTVWNSILGFFKGVWAFIVGIFSRAIATVVGWFKWLYDHNYYVKAAVDAIVTAVKVGVAWLTNAWQVTVKWIGDKWHDMIGLATSAWNGVVGVFKAVWGWISGVLSALWGNISRWWTGLVTNFSTWAGNVWKQVSTVFSSAWSKYIAGPVASIATSLAKWAAGLATSAWQWGVNLIQQLINGLMSMIGSVLSTAGDIAAQIAKALGFHSPTEWGPGRDADKWAPALINMLVGGLVAGIPRVQAAALMVASAMSLASGSGSMALSVAGAVSGSVGSGALSSFRSGGSFASGGATSFLMPPQRSVPGPIIVTSPPIYIDGRELVQALGPHLAREVLVQLGSRGVP